MASQVLRSSCPAAFIEHGNSAILRRQDGLTPEAATARIQAALAAGVSRCDVGAP